MRHHSLPIALLAGIALWPSVVQTQSGVTVTTVADRDHVTVMQLTGIYDHQPPSNIAFEVAIRQAVAREYFRTHDDDVDFIVTISKFGYDLGADEAGGAKVGGRYYSVKNDISGIGTELFDHSADFGSNGRLQGYIDIGTLSRLVTDPTDPRFETTLGILAHEVMHRWGASVRFNGSDGTPRDALRGRDGRHWSFLLDSHNSVLYGNDWQDNGNGTYTSVGRSRSFYSPLDLYLMGFLDRNQVPPITLIENPEIDAGRLPQLGATISGSPKTITIDDIIASEGARSPSAADAPKRFKIAYIFLVRPEEDATPFELSAVNTIRDAFATRFLILTGGKGVMESFPEPPAGSVPAPDPILPPSSGPRTAPVDLGQAVAWVLSRQSTDGAFADSPWTRVRDTAAAIALLNESPAAFAAQQKGLAWLATAPDAGNVDAAARRVIALAPQFSAADVAFLTNTRNASGGWGLLRHFASDTLDTALALTALGPSNAADVTFLVATQNADGGWPVQPNGASSVVATLAVLSLESRAPPSALQQALTRARSWLEARQQADGGFGDGGSSASATAAAVLYLGPTDFPRTSLGHALDYLRRTQLADGSWNESVYETALAVRALKAGELVNPKAGAISFTPTAPNDGDTVQIVATIVNTALEPVTDLVVRITDGPPANGLPIGSDIVIPTLAALAETQVTATWDTTNKSGAHEIFVTADPDGHVAESNEGDNTASQALTVIAPPDRADLAVSAADLLLAPTALRTIPQAQSLTVRVANGGRTDAPQTVVQVFDGNPASGGVSVAQTAVDVPARSQAQAALTFNIGTPGDHRYYVVVDPLNQIVEASEQNNTASIVLPMEPTVDFVVAADAIAFSENPIALARNLTISVPVTNQGTTDAFAVKVRVVLNEPGSPLELGTISVDLPAGHTRTASVVWHTIRAANGVPVVVSVDSNNALAEVSETNNTATAPLTVTAAQGVNLHVTEQELFVTSPLHQAGAGTVSIPVHNFGSAAASNVSVAFYLGVPASGGVLIGTQTIPTIAAGGQATASIAWNPVTALGNKIVFVAVDQANAIAEYDEDDNTAFITVKALSLPDLVISSASIAFLPAFPRQGDPITVAATITNTGEQPAANVRVRVFNGDPAHGGTQIGSDQIVAQIPGLFAAVAQVTLAPQASAGMSQIHVLVDPGNEIAESNESNNSASRTLGVQDGSVWVSNKYFSPNGDEVLDTTDVFFRLDGSTATSVAVRDPFGTTVRTFSLAEPQMSGSVTWDGRADDGMVVGDALYSLTVLSSDGRAVASATATVDTNRAGMGAGLGPEFLVDTNLSCTAGGFVKADGYNVQRFQTAGWLPDDSGVVQWFASQDRCDSLFCQGILPNGLHPFVFDPMVGVYITSADGQTRRRITPDSWTTVPQQVGPQQFGGFGTVLKDVVVSPDGEKVLIVRQQYGYPGAGAWSLDSAGQRAELWAINRDGSGLVNLGVTFIGWTPRWSPDSRRVAFLSLGSGPQTVVVVDADGGNRKLIGHNFSGAFLLRDVTWSPDSRQVLYAALEFWVTERRNVVIARNADGTGQGAVVHSSLFLNDERDAPFGFQSFDDIQWMGNDRFVKVVRGSYEDDWFHADDSLSQVWEYSTAGTGRRPLALSVANVREVRVSPDGRTIAYTDAGPGDGFTGFLNPGPATGVWLIHADRSEERVYSVATPFALFDTFEVFERTILDRLEWSRDGRQLFFTEMAYTAGFEGGGVFLYPPQLRVIETSDRSISYIDYPQSFSYPFLRRMVPQRATPDGQSYLYVAIEEDFSIWTQPVVTKTEFITVSLRDRRQTTIAVDDSLSHGRTNHNPYYFDYNFRFSPSGNVLLYDSDRDSLPPFVFCPKEYLHPGLTDPALHEAAIDLFTATAHVNLSAEFGFQRQRSQVLIKGTAQDLNFAEYHLEYSPVGSGAWSPIGAPSAVPVVNGVLGTWIPPADGRFDVRLTASDKAGNVASTTKRLTWGLRASITNVSVTPRLFSPNGDGITDALTIDYLVLGPVHLDFQIFNSNDVLVRSISQSHATIGPASIAWDGRNEEGVFVAEGTYRIHVLDYDFFVTVDVTPPSLNISLGSALHIVPQKQQCRTIGTKQTCVTLPGPLVDTPYTEMPGHVIDANLASWLLEAGQGSNPSEWQLLQQGTTPLRGADVLDTVMRTFTDPRDVAGRRFRLSAVDHAGNPSVLVSGFAPEELILFGWDGAPVPTQRPLLHTSGLHQISLAHTLRAPLVQLSLQYRPAGELAWALGPSAGSATPLFDLAWDNSPLAGGKLYDVRLLARDVNDNVFASNTIQIRPDLFVLTLFDAKTQLTHGQASLREPAGITLVMADGDVNIGGFSVFSTDVDFTIPLLPDPTLTTCESRSVRARYKAVGASGAVSYSNTMTVIRPGAKRDTSCERPDAKLLLDVRAREASGCGAPNPHKVHIRLSGIGVDPESVRLSIQDAPFGLLKPWTGVTLPFELDLATDLRQEGTYRIVATGTAIGAPVGSGAVSASASFVVDRQAPTAQITYPGSNQSLCAVQVATQALVTIEGIAEDANFDRYAVEFGEGQDPASWSTIFPRSIDQEPLSRSPKRGPLATWNVTTLERGYYTVRLKVWDKGGNVACTTVTFFIAGTVQVQNVTAVPRVFSPNEDGQFDTATIAYGLSMDARVDARVHRIVNGQIAPAPVRTLITGTQELSGANAVEWDGLADDGSTVLDGRYRVFVTAQDGCGFSATSFADIEVDNAPPEAVIASPRTTDEPGVTVDIIGSVADPHFDRYVVEVGVGDAPESWTRLATARTTIESGLLAKWQNKGVAGDYTLRLSAYDTVGNIREAIVPITIPDRQFLVTDAAVEPTLISPNGDQKVDTTEIVYTTVQPASIVIDVVNREGVAVATLATVTVEAPVADQRVPWTGVDDAGAVVPDGEYIVRISATSLVDPTRKQTENTTVIVDNTKPTLTLSMPADQSFVRSPVEVLGTIDDRHMAAYTVRFRAAGTGATDVIFASGDQSQVMASLGTLDPPAGSYVITLDAVDGAHNSATRSVSFVVDNTAPSVSITQPVAGASLGGSAPTVAVHGTITEANLDQWTLRFGSGPEPDTWTTISTGSGTPPAELLASWGTTTVDDGAGTLSLVAVDRTGATSEARVPVQIDNAPPVALIAAPLSGARITAATTITGTASDDRFKSATLELAPGNAEQAFAFSQLTTLGHRMIEGELFRWQTLPADGLYTLRLTVEDEGGLTSSTMTTVMLDTQPPAPLTSVAATLEDRRNARIEWSASDEPGLGGYNVYRNGQKINAALVPAATTTYLDSGLSDGSHRYVVTVVDGAGLESKPSNEVQLHVDTTPPTANLLAPASGASIEGPVAVRGTAAAVDLKEYRVLISTAAGPFTLLKRSFVSTTSAVLADFDATGMVDGATVTVRLEAEDFAGNTSHDEAIVTVDNRPPAKPVLLSATQSAGVVTVTWQTSGESDLLGILLFNNDLLANARRFVLDPGLYVLKGTSYVDLGLADGDYRYYAVAIDKAGNQSEPSNAISVAIEIRAPAAWIVQPAPDARVDQPFALIGATFDEDVARFQFQYRRGAGAWTNIGGPITTNPPQATWDPATVPSASYGAIDLRVVATDRKGNTDPNPQIITVHYQDLTAPPTVTGLAAAVTADAVALTWNASSGSDLGGYAVYREDSNGLLWKVATTAPDTASYVDRPPADGRYRYSVTAFDVNNNESAPSQPVSARVYTPTIGALPSCATTLMTSVTGGGVEAGAVVTLSIDRESGAAETLITTAGADGRFRFNSVVLARGANAFQVQAADGAGNISKPSASVVVAAVLPPPAPSGFAASVSGRNVTLRWDEPADAVVGYRLERDGVDQIPVVVDAPGTATASADDGSNLAAHAIDGDPASAWMADVSIGSAAWWQLTLPAPMPLQAMQVTWRPDAVARDFDIQFWNGLAWATVHEITGNAWAETQWSVPLTTTMLRIVVKSGVSANPMLAEVRLIRERLVTGTSFTEILPDGHHVYRLIPVHAAGTCSVEGPAAELTVTVGDVVPPAPPTNLVAEVAGGLVTLRWIGSPDPSAIGYRVYRAAGGDWVRLHWFVGGTMAFDNPPRGGYSYRVTAVDAIGNESLPSNEAHANVDVVTGGVAPILRYPTDAAQPKTLRQEQTTIAGTADPGALITIVRDGYAEGTTMSYAAPAADSFPLGGTPAGGVAFDTRASAIAAFIPEIGNALTFTDVYSRQRELVPGVVGTGRPSLSPDGSMIAYTAEIGGYLKLVVFDRASKTTVREMFLPSGTVTWHDYSPDGQWIALAITQPFPVDPDDPDDPYVPPPESLPKQLWLANPVTGFIGPLTFSLVVRDQFAWSPDSRQIAYIAGGNTLQVTSVFGTTVDIGSNGAQSPAFSPDGRQLAFVSGQSGAPDIWIYDFTFRTTTPLASDGPDVIERRLPAFSPDGRYLAYLQKANGSPAYALALRDLPTGFVLPVWSEAPFATPLWTDNAMLIVVDGGTVTTIALPGHFRVDGVPLDPGLNLMSAVATDVFGNDSLPAEPIALTRDTSDAIDVVVDGLLAYPDLVISGNSVRLSTTIRNASTVPAAAFDVVFFATDDRGDARQIGTRRIEGLAGGAELALALDWNTQDLSGRYLVDVIADMHGMLAESTRTNNRGSLEVLVSSGGSPSVSIRTDRTSYAANENVQLQIDVVNPGRSDRFTLDVVIEDAAGQAAAALGSQEIPALGFGVQPVTFNWLTADTLAGSYRAHARLTDSSGHVLDAFSSFVIAGQRTINASVTTDRRTYFVADAVQIRGSVQNTSANVESGAVIAVTQVLDTAGVEVLRFESALESLQPHARADVPVTWAAASAGAFTVRVAVRSADVELAAASASFTVEGVAKMTGQVRAAAAAVPHGQAVAIAAEVVNAGTLALAAVPLKLVVQDPDTKEAVHTFERTVDLPVGARLTWDVTAATGTLRLKTYSVLLQSVTTAVTTLASTGVTLIDAAAPVVQIVSPTGGSVFNTAVALSALVSDTLSPVDRVEYQIDGGPWQLLPLADPALSRYGTEYPASPTTGGVHTFSVRATDQAGNGADLSPSDANPMTVTFTIGDNQAPVAADQTVHLDEDTTLAIRLGATDPDGDPLTFVVTAPSHGTLSGTAPDLVYTPDADFHGNDSVTFTVSDGAATSNSATVSIQVMPVNDPPSAAAGANQTVSEGDTVTLDGSAADVDGDGLTMTWTQVAGPTVSLQHGNTLRPTFVAPDVAAGGATLTFSLVVFDGQATSEAALTNVLIKNVNHPPVAQAGIDQRVGSNVQVTLDGSASYDPDADQLTYAWRQVDGPPVTISGETAALASFTAPAANTTLTFELTVSDGIDEATDLVSVQIEVTNHPPVANAGVDQAVKEGDAVQLDGRGSSDPDQDALTFWWQQVSGTPVVLDNRASALAAFAAPAMAGASETLTFELEVTDIFGARASDRVDVRVLTAAAPPSCSTAQPSVAVLWPPNHQLVPVRIVGLGPGASGITVQIQRVTQDEPVNGTGDGDTGPDASISGDTVALRAERSGNGNGRVYRVWFRAVNTEGGSCDGSVLVSVPHNQGRPAIDDGQRYESSGVQR